MSGFAAESGGGDLARVIMVRDNSRAACGIPEKDELGEYKSVLLGFVEKVDFRGLITETTQLRPQPRNWHELVKDDIEVEGVKIPDRRADIALIVDHQNEFPYWRMDDNPSSPYLDDWFSAPFGGGLTGPRVNGSTRFVDNKDPKGRTALLAQLIIIKDDPLQQYSPALNLGPHVGEHELAGAGFVFDPSKDFLGKLSTFWTTNHQDEEGKGREKTPHGYLGMRHDAHIEMPGTDHGRLHIARDPCDDYDEMPKKFGGAGGSAPSDSGGDGQEPQTHFYKARLMWDHTVKGQDTGLPKESAQIRPVYHCVDVPERKKIINNYTFNKFQQITKFNQVINNNGGITIIIIFINNGGPQGSGGGTIIIKPGEPPVIIEHPPQPGDAPPREDPPGGSDGGRIICIPLSHNPPLLDGMDHTGHGYIAISENGQGGHDGWIGGWHKTPGTTEKGGSTTGGPSTVDGDPFLDDPNFVLSADWAKLVLIPPGTDKGSVPVSDGNGGFTWDPRITESDFPPPPVFEPFVHPNDDGTGLVDIYDNPIVSKPQGTPDGYVPTGSSSDALGVTWQPVASMIETSPGLPQGYIYGFNMAYNSGSPSAVDVGGSVARDSTDTFNIKLSGPVSADYLSTGGPLKNDALTTASIGGATATLTNAAEASADTLVVLSSSTALLAALPFSTLTGLVDVSIPDANRVATMSPHAASTTKFISELAVGDIVGVNGVGFYCVLAIDSDISARVMRGSAAISDSGIARSGYSFINYGPMVIQVGGTSTPSKFVAAWDGGNGFLTFGRLNSNTNGSGLNFVMGQPTAGGKTWTDAGARVYPLPSWIFLWARRKADGTSTVSWSTQRTTPYTPSALSGYSIWRRVGVVPLRSDNFVPAFTQTDFGGMRFYMYEEDFNNGGFVLNNAVGTGAGWFPIWLGTMIPPVSRACLLNIQVAPSGALGLMRVRASNTGDAAQTRYTTIRAVNNTETDAEYFMTTDRRQYIDWTSAGGVLGAYSMAVVGYYDRL